MSAMKTTRRLPQGLQSFVQIRKEGYVIVDKTDLVWKIANGVRYNFLNRPRRFGKSLLTDTLACYLAGKKELFEGMKIMDLEQEWPQRHVFRFDFSGHETAQGLERYLQTSLELYEQKFGKSPFTGLADKFSWLMQQACEQTGYTVGVVVDEYDSPLQHTLFNPTEHEKFVQVYRSFFPALKTSSQYLKCLFITGITKFTQLSLFSTLNNVSVLSTMPEYATVCGFTHQEIIDNFQPELEAMGQKFGQSVDQVLNDLRDMYDGYHFSDDTAPEKAVYNPFSLINALAEGRLRNYWAASGGSDLLDKMLQRTEVNKETLDGCTIDRDTLDLADVTPDNIPLFLYQCGYLTIKGASKHRYTLGFPNNEVRRSLYKIVLPNALRKRSYYVDNIMGDIQQALDNSDVATAMEKLKQLISSVPFAHDSEEYLTEERYRYLLKIAFYLVGCHIEEEKPMASGIIDLVAHYDNCILVMELKLDSNGGLKAAKEQLDARNYAAAFAAEDKPVYAIAIELGSHERSITAYDITRCSV